MLSLIALNHITVVLKVRWNWEASTRNTIYFYIDLFLYTFTDVIYHAGSLYLWWHVTELAVIYQNEDWCGKQLKVYSYKVRLSYRCLVTTYGNRTWSYSLLVMLYFISYVTISKLVLITSRIGTRIHFLHMTSNLLHLVVVN